jgi:excinuclease ABC subunit C
MISAPLELQIKMVSNVPRVYQYFDKYDVIIYFAWANNLKIRVNSYTTKTHNKGKTRILVKNSLV